MGHRATEACARTRQISDEQPDHKRDVETISEIDQGF